MGEPAQPLRSERAPRWLALPLAAAGLAVLLWALAGFLRLAITARPPGNSAGGAADRAERCRRSVPDAEAAACIEAGVREQAAAAVPLAVGAMLGAGLLVLSARAGRRARPSPNQRRAP